MQHDYEEEIIDKITIAEDEAKPKAPEEKKPGKTKAAAPTKAAVVKSVRTLLRDIGITFVIMFVASRFFEPTVVYEHSMENTLFQEDYVVLSKHAYGFGDVRFGDVLVFESILLDKNGKTKNLVKRAVGLPGDILEVKDNAVYRNGERLDEPYTKEGVTLGEMGPVTVPYGAYFVLGDNRQVSKDSRNAAIGLVYDSKLKGKVVFRLLPISGLGKVS